MAVAFNERSYNAAFIKEMRKSLDSNGLSHVKTIAPDSWGHMWAIVDDMKKDKDLTAAIDVIGSTFTSNSPLLVTFSERLHVFAAHQECTGAPIQMPPPGTMALGKPLWSTEQHIGEIGSFGGCASSKENIDLPVWDLRAGMAMARTLNQGYLIANMTSTLIWTPVYSWYEYLL